MSNEALQLSADSFERNVIGTGEACLVEFMSQWCASCRGMAPILDDLADEFAGRVCIYTVDIGSEPGLGSAYDVKSVPTLLYFRDGAVERRVVGPVRRSTLGRQMSAFVGAADSEAQ